MSAWAVWISRGRGAEESVKVLVVLGHSGCGAVTGAVDAYLRPLKYWSKTTTPALRSILQKIFVSVREGALTRWTSLGARCREKSRAFVTL